MEIIPVDFKNYRDAIKIQNTIFPREDGTINILVALDTELFIKTTGILYDNDNARYYIGYEENKQIGITGIYHYKTDEAWLAWVGILPKYRRLGYGKRLLEKTIELARSQNYKIMRLYTDKIDNASAIVLYEKLGFIGEKYTREKLPFYCRIYSMSLTDDKVTLLNNRNLNLSNQMDMEFYDKDKIKEILEKYEKVEKNYK